MERKSYVTCALHLKFVINMTVKSCINVLRRFISRFGHPKTIISTNAKTFKRADLEQLLRHTNIQQITAHKDIFWKYIPERAAWWGDFWEPLVCSIKNCLKAVIDKSKLSFDEIPTFWQKLNASFYYYSKSHFYSSRFSNR